MPGWGGKLSPLSGLIWEIVKIQLVREILHLSVKSQGVSETSGYDTMISYLVIYKLCFFRSRCSHL